MDEFEQIARAIEPVAQLSEIKASGSQQAWKAVAGLINAVTVCGVLTWLGWAAVLIGKWVAG